METPETKPTDLDIMMYLDGELTEDESKSVRAYLESEPVAQKKREAIHEMGVLLRGTLEIETDEAQGRLARLWDNIERGLNDSPRTDNMPAPVVAPVTRPSVKERLKAWFASWQSNLVTGAVCAAAVVVIMNGIEKERTVPQQLVQQTDNGMQRVPALVPAVSRAPEVENLEVYEGTGSILTVAGDDDDGVSAVIWISSEEDLGEEPI